MFVCDKKSARAYVLGIHLHSQPAVSEARINEIHQNPSTQLLRTQAWSSFSEVWALRVLQRDKGKKLPEVDELPTDVQFSL